MTREIRKDYTKLVLQTATRLMMEAADLYESGRDILAAEASDVALHLFERNWLVGGR